MILWSSQQFLNHHVGSDDPASVLLTEQNQQNSLSLCTTIAQQSVIAHCLISNHTKQQQHSILLRHARTPSQSKMERAVWKNTTLIQSADPV
jgi:hypothetical protein